MTDQSYSTGVTAELFVDKLARSLMDTAEIPFISAPDVISEIIVLSSEASRISIVSIVSRGTSLLKLIDFQLPPLGKSIGTETMVPGDM